VSASAIPALTMTASSPSSSVNSIRLCLFSHVNVGSSSYESSSSNGCYKLQNHSSSTEKECPRHTFHQSKATDRQVQAHTDGRGPKP
jgi:hypothetical protein